MKIIIHGDRHVQAAQLVVADVIRRPRFERAGRDRSEDIALVLLI